MNATGLPFNSLEAVERSGDGRTNPMVNPGAIAATSLVPGTSVEERWHFVHDGLSRFAGRELVARRRGLRSASATNHRNQGLARLLQSYDRLYADPAEAVDLYTRQCCLAVTARDLAVMGATLADGGVNPLTDERVVDAESCHCTLAVMTTAGLYETSGDWLYDIGLPGQERHRRRHRHGRAGQGRPRHVRAAARRGGQQRQGAARRRLPVAPARARPLRVESPSVRRLALVALVALARSPRAACGASLAGRAALAAAVRAGRAARRAERATAQPGEPYVPIDVDLLFGEPTVALRGPWGTATS